MVTDTVDTIESRQRIAAVPLSSALKLALPVYILCLAAITLSRMKGMLPPIWLADAVIVYALLNHSRRYWPFLLLVAYLADVLAALSIGDSMLQAFSLPFFNMIECVLVAMPLRLLDYDKNFARPQSLLVFYALAALAPLVSSVLGAGFLHFDFGRPFLATAVTWYGAAALGLFILVPPLMTVHLSALVEMFSRDKLAGTAFGLAVMAVTVTLNYTLRTHPIAFLFFPAVVLLAFQRGFAGGIVGVAIAAAYILVPVLLNDPDAPLKSYGAMEQLMVLQLFIAVMGLSVVLVGAALEERRRLERGLAAAIDRAEEAREVALVAREEALIAREVAEEANRAKSMFLANMSHELRTPLNAVIGFSQTMEEETFGPHANAKYKEYSGLIHRAGAHLLEVINDILDMSRIEAGRFELHCENVDAAAIASECVDLMQDAASRGGLTVHAAIGKEPMLVHADRRALKQIMLNLLGNAVKFTLHGGRIDVSLARVDNGVTISVRDTGIGIPAAKLQNAGSPFMQFHEGTGRQGTGLGLALVRSLTGMQGGSFHIESREGAGTVVTVTLPDSESTRAAA